MLTRLKKKNKKKNNLKISHLMLGGFLLVVVFAVIKFKAGMTPPS